MFVVFKKKRASLINSWMIEKWNYLYLFIIHDADVIKYLCLSFSRFAWFSSRFFFHVEIFFQLIVCSNFASSLW